MINVIQSHQTLNCRCIVNKLPKAYATLIAVCIFTFLYAAMSSVGNTAQDPKTQPSSGQFQISTWSHAGSPGNVPMHGAYIIDSETGRVWEIIADHAPKEIGSVRK